MTFELNDYENDDNDNNNNVYFIIKDSYYTPNANIDFIVNLKIFTHSGMTSLSFPNQI